MLRYVLPLALMMTAPLAAQDVPAGLAEHVAAQAAKCWNLLPMDLQPQNTVELSVTVDPADGQVRETPEITSAADTLGKRAVASAAQKAVVRCGPYDLPENFSGPIEITMIPQ